MKEKSVDKAILDAIALINEAKDDDQKISYEVRDMIDKTPFSKNVTEITVISIKLERPLA